ncbi:MAG: response regulator, partial [bacterium]|nr:response regulator [bacterium]
LEQDKLQLEQTVRDRTKEVYQKNELLEEQSQKLKELDRVKSRFFANISHEFRTPLTLIMGPLEQMLAASGTKEQQQKIDMMLRNSQRLMRLINQLLDLSRFDSGKMTLQAGQYNIVLFLKFILESFHLLAEQKKLHLEFHSQVEDTPLYFDLPKMEEVIYNLLINAVKFTPGGGTITVSVTRATRNTPGVPDQISDFLKISVRDTGIGMSREQMAQVFDRFYRVEGGGEGNFGGTGIGLALAKESVTLHHGQIDVHSTKGQGTEFVVHLPLGKDHLKPGEIVESENTSTLPPTQKPGQLEESYILHPETRQSDAHDSPAQNQEKQIVLVVDDNADMRQYIRGPLDPLYAVVEAQDGKEGIQKAKEVIPDLIISDVMMPQVDGFELCHTLKKDVETSHIPIILLTAKVSEDSIIEGLKTGADDYIAKPFNTNILIARIKNLIDLRRQLQLKFQRQTMLMPAEVEVSPIDREFIEEFREVVEQNLSDPDLKIDTLCKKLIMSRMSLFRKVEALTGETPKQFIKSYRLQRAAQLLKDNFGNVTDIALEVGFSSSAYFAKSFKDKYHQTPSDFQSSNS